MIPAFFGIFLQQQLFYKRYSRFFFFYPAIALAQLKKILYRRTQSDEREKRRAKNKTDQCLPTKQNITPIQNQVFSSKSCIM